MVKGLSRRVIVVPAPDPKLFDQAVFFLREDAGKGPGITEQQLLEQAARAAAGYLGTAAAPGPAPRRLAGPVWCLAGGALASLIWALAVLL